MAMVMGKNMAVALMFLAAVAVVSTGDGLCNIPMKGLMSCRPCVSGPDSVEPTEDCCSALAVANWPCLCSCRPYMHAYGIDPERAMQLPSKCNLPTSPVKC